jgi:hypothetical protein
MTEYYMTQYDMTEGDMTEVNVTKGPCLVELAYCIRTQGTRQATGKTFQGLLWLKGSQGPWSQDYVCSG